MIPIIQSAGYFTVIEISDDHSYGFITLASGQTEKRILCRRHAYLLLDRLLAAKQLDEFEAMHIRTQIADSLLPPTIPDEVEGDIQQLIKDGEDAVRSVFNQDYFHPAIEEFLAAEAVGAPPVPMILVSNPARLQ